MKSRLPHSPYVEISIDNLLHNLAQVRFAAAGLPLMAVVKDRAYGCGAVVTAGALERNGVDYLAVARPEEARHLRACGIGATILVFGQSSEDDRAWGFRNGIHFALNDTASCREWVQSATPVTFHCNFDTGMGRMGIDPKETGELLRLLSQAAHLRFEGAMTHFSCADIPGSPTVEEQLRVFRDALDVIRAAGHNPPLIHAANSAAILGDNRARDLCTLVRPGITLYGCRPDPSRDPGIDLRGIASLRGPVVQVKQVPEATPISYGGRYTTTKQTWICTVHIGYAHGLPRALTNKGFLLIRGRNFPIAGTVTMDYTMVDLGGSTDIEVGDEAVAIGTQAGAHISADEVALQAGTIGYEVLCGINPLLRRYYLHGNDVIHFQDELFH